MAFPMLTSAYTALLAFVYLGLTAWVTGGRGQHKVIHGDGGNASLNRRIRAHANFIEYVPLILFMAALLEAGGVSHATIHLLLLPLLIARIMHPVGMVAVENSRQQYLFRAPGALITWIVLAAAAVLLLWRLV